MDLLSAVAALGPVKGLRVGAQHGEETRQLWSQTAELRPGFPASQRGDFGPVTPALCLSGDGNSSLGTR